MVRVARRGGRIVMGNWIPGDPTLVAQVLKISAGYTPAPHAGFISPVTWGVEANVVERFMAAGIAAEDISCSRETYTFQSMHSPLAFLDDFRQYYGPTMNAYAAAAQDGRADELHAELSALFVRENRAADPSTTRIPATFLKVCMTRR
jgi:hypothetical protein